MKITRNCKKIKQKTLEKDFHARLQVYIKKMMAELQQTMQQPSNYRISVPDKS